MKYRVIKKPRRFMYPYVAVHGRLPKNELPERMRRIHHNTIYIRDDVCRNPGRERRILLHEYREMELMDRGYRYKQAHRRAGY